MSAVGGQLRQAREERKLSLADVTKETKIQPWVLEALEADRLQELMSPIYVKAFLTTYARFLHLQPESLVTQLRWPNVETTQATLPPAQSAPSIPVAVTFSPPRLRQLGAVAVAAAMITGLMMLKPIHRVKPTAAVSKPSQPKLASITPVEEPIKPSSPTLALLQTQPLELAVAVNRTTWIQVRADGKLLAQQRVLRGSNERWTAKKQFELIVSKPSQVELTLNGQSITPFAIAHQGRLLITHRGITPLPDEDQ